MTKDIEGMQREGPRRSLTFHGNTVKCRCDISKAFDHLLRVLTERTITMSKCHEHTENENKFEEYLNEILPLHAKPSALSSPCSRSLDTNRIEWLLRLASAALIYSRITLLQRIRPRLFKRFELPPLKSKLELVESMYRINLLDLQ